MSFLATVTAHFNIPAQCRRLGVPLWSCPSFLFLIMGLINVCAILASYYIARQYASPELVILVVLGLSAFLFTVSFTIINAFEQVVLARQREAAKHEELVRIKDQFVFIAAHELRTPANAIRWALESLEAKEPLLFKKEKGIFETFLISSKRLLDLVKDLLEVSRIETGSVTLRLSPISIAAVVLKSLRGLRSFIDESGMQIVNKIPDSLPLVLADESRLKEVVDNLINNAIKYNRKNGTVTLTAKHGGGGVTLHVTDEGGGIAPEDRPHIFEKFWRSVDAHAIEGTGLGLFIVQKLLELMHGHVSFETKVGIGTTFSVFVPQTEECLSPLLTFL